MILTTTLAFATTISYLNQSDFSLGTYNFTQWNSNGYIETSDNATIKGLPNGGVNDGFVNMSGNVLLLHFNESVLVSGNQINDSSGNDNLVFLYNNNADTNKTSEKGQVGNCLYFDSSNDRIYIDDSDIKDIFDEGDSFSIEFWFNPTSVPSASKWWILFSKAFTSYVSPYYQIDIRYTYNKDICAYLWQSGDYATHLSVCDLDTPSYPHNVNNWYHVVMTADTSNDVLKLYVNGEIRGTDDTPTGSYSNHDTSISYGVNLNTYTSNNDYDYNGYFDEIALYNRTLSAEEVELHYKRQTNYTGIANYISEIYDTGAQSEWQTMSFDTSLNDKTFIDKIYTSDNISVTASAEWGDGTYPAENSYEQDGTCAYSKSFLPPDHTNQNIIYGFDKEYDFNKVRLINPYTAYNTNSFSLYYSKDGSSWTFITTDNLPNNCNDWVEVSFEPVRAKYIKWQANSHHSWGAGLGEIEFFYLSSNITMKIRSCDDSLCVGEDWIGPYGNGSIEMPNNKGYSLAGFNSVNMSGNILLLHLNNDSSYGENNTHAYDFSGEENNASIINGTTYTTSGKIYGAYSFDGGDDEINGTISGISTNGTICFWINPETDIWEDSTQQRIVSLGDSSGDDYNDVVVRVHPNNYIQIFISDGDSFSWVASDKSDNWIADEWYHICGVWNSGSTSYLYMNGVQEASNSTDETPSISRYRISGSLGASEGSSNFGGTLDEISIWNRSLSADEIKTIYAMTYDNYFKNSSSINISTLPDNRYFQYKIFFDSDNRTYSPYIYNVTFDYNSIAKVFWMQTFNLDNNSRIIFPINSTVRIKTKVWTIDSLTIKYPNGTTAIDSGSLTNETPINDNQAVYYYDFIPNETGWYNVTFGNGEFYSNAFYVGNVWSDTWIDSSLTTYPFRFQLNISEPNVISRRYEPIDIPVNFTYKTNNNSVRVTLYNGTNLIDVPYQLYNKTYDSGYISSANLVLPSSMNRSENITYFVFYSRSNLGNPNYTSELSCVNTSDFYEISNNEYKAELNKTKGGLIENIYNYNKLGENTYLTNTEPIQFSPEVSDGISNYRAYQNISPAVTITNGTLLTIVNTEGKVGTAFNYNITYKFFSNLPYILVDTNISSVASGTWQNYYDARHIVTDGIMSNFNYKNSSGVYDVNATDGDGTDYSNLGDVDWLSVYNNAYGNGIAALFISRDQSQAYTPYGAFYDGSSFEYYFRNQYTGSVTSGDYFYSRDAFVLYNSLHNSTMLNKTYYQLKNPVNTTLGSTQTNDTIDPQYSNTGYTPVTVNDTSNITCYGYFTDNLEVDYVIVNITSGGYNNISTHQVNSNESWVNRTIDASDLEAGENNCTFTIYDIATRSNTTSVTFTVTDLTSPYFTYINHTPYASAGLDPNTQINISANLTEYNNISSAKLQYRLNTSLTWINQTMTLQSINGYVSNYTGNFTPDSEGIWQYRIAVLDNQGNSNTSDIQNLSVYYDWTWTHSPATISAVSGSLGTNMTVGNIAVNNTGDKDLFFKITSNWEDKTKIFFNASQENSIGYNFTLASGNNTTIPVNVTGKTTERSDSLTITINPQNSSASPSSNTTSTTIVSYAGGPFLLVTITQYNLSVTQQDYGVDLQAKVENKGNETATNVWLNFNLPSGWTLSSGSRNVSIGTLVVDGMGINSITVDIDSDATTGTRTLRANSGCTENKTGSDSVSVAVNEYSSSTTEITETTSGGGGAAGGMGGGASASQRAKLFQTEETYEIVRGEDQSFILKVENPYEGVLENVTVTVAGFLEQYLRIEPLVVNLIPQNDSYEFIIYIEAPDYFTKGIYNLNFTIDGIIKKPVLVENKTQYIKTKLKESRVITLEVHEVSKEEALSYINSSIDLIADMESLELYTLDMEYLREDLLDYLEDKDYESARDIYNQILDLKEKAFSTLDLLEEVESNINLSIYNGIDVSKTQRLALLARAALARGDYSTALQRADDAKITYALETAGKFNVVAYVKNNFFQVTASLILIIIFSYLSYLTIKLKVIQYKIKQYRDEESVILGLIRETQRECFEKRKMSMKEYTESLMQYENRMSKIVKESIKLETIKINLFKLFKGKKKRFLEEKDRVLNLIKETQILYMKGGNIETSIYKNRMKSYTERLAELEENLANIEAREAMGEVTSKIKLPKLKLPKIKLKKK